jgi:hypothetical protein
MKLGGIGFIHHSNIGAFKDPHTGALTVVNQHWRGASMHATLFRQFCQRYGLVCLSQEIVAWGGDILNDCFSLFTRSNKKMSDATRIFENKDFMREALNLKKISELYKIAQRTI